MSSSGQTLRFTLAATLLAACLTACTQQSERDLVAAAKSSLAKNDANAAVIQLKSALQKNAGSGELRFLLGQALLAAGKPRDAAVELKKARELKFDDNLVAPLLAKALLGINDFRQLVELFATTTLADATATADLKISLATAYLAQSKVDRGRNELQAALRLDPKSVSGRLLQSRLAAGEGRFDEALQIADTILAQEPKSAAAWILKGELLAIGRNDMPGSIAAFRQALAIDSRDLRAHGALLQALLQQGDTAGFRNHMTDLVKLLPESYIARFYSVLLATMDKDLAKAQTGVQQLLKITPNFPPLLQLAGAVELQTNALTQAKTHLAQALQLSPDLSGARRLLAEAHLRGGDPAQALATLKPALEQAKPDAEFLGLAGQAYLQAGDAARAEEYYTMAVKANPEDAKARVVLALAQVTKGNAAAALAQLQSLAATDKSTYADLALVSTLVRGGDLPGALAAVDRLTAKTPEHALPYLMRGRLLLQRGDAGAARVAFETALSKDPVYFDAASELATLDLKEGKPAQAKKRFDDVLAREPKHAQARFAAIELRRRGGAKVDELEAPLLDAIKANPTEVAPRRLLIQLLLDAGRAKPALAAAQEAIAAVPDSDLLLEALGRAQLAAGEGLQAGRTFQQIASRSRAPESHLRLANIYLGSQNYVAAEQSLKRALELAPKMVAAQRQLAQLYTARKRHPEALRLARQMQSQRPQEATGFALESELHAAQRAWDLAINAALAALARERSSAMAIRLHALYGVAGKADAAASFAKDWQREQPRDADFIFHLGALAMERRENAEAEALFRQVLALRPKSAGALNNIAALMILQGKPGALAIAQQAHQLLPDEAPILDTMASAYAQQNDLKTALEWQRKAAAKDPATPTYRLNLAKLLIQAGEKQQAKAELDKLSALGGRFAGHAEVTSLLKSI